MAQDMIAVDHWELIRETIELIPLVVSAAGSTVTNYTVTACAAGARPTNFTTPTSAGADLGYLVNGPLLGKGSFEGYVKISSNPETPAIPAFTLELT